jgi:hypothetical protein
MTFLVAPRNTAKNLRYPAQCGLPATIVRRQRGARDEKAVWGSCGGQG